MDHSRDKKNKIHAKAKKTGSDKLQTKFESLRREIKADIKKQHGLYVNKLVGDVKTNPEDFYRYINTLKKRQARYSTPPLLKKRGGNGVAELDSER